MTTHPEVLWAQRSSESDEKKNVVYLTVNLTEIDEKSLEYKLTPTGLTFKAKTGSGPQEYTFAIDFFGEIVPEESTKRLTTRALTAVLRKKEIKAEFWPRLTKDKAKLLYVKTDFSKWVDEDEQDGEPVKGFDDDFDGGFGAGGAGFGGAGGAGFGGGGGGMDFGGATGGMDFSRMMAQAGAGGGGPSSMPDMDDDDDEPMATTEDDDDDGPPPLEDVTPHPQ